MKAPTFTTIEKEATPVASGDIFLVILLNEFHSIAIFTENNTNKLVLYEHQNIHFYVIQNGKTDTKE